MGNKNKTNTQISEFEFIKIKNNNMFESKLHRIVEKNKITFHSISFQRIDPLFFVLSTCTKIKANFWRNYNYILTFFLSELKIIIYVNNY